MSLGLITHGSDVRKLHRHSQGIRKKDMRDVHLIWDGTRAQVELICNYVCLWRVRAPGHKNNIIKVAITL